MTRDQILAAAAPSGAPLGSATMSRELANASNYYRWIQDLMFPFLGESVLDVGTGNGRHIAPFVGTRRIVALEPAPEFVALLKGQFGRFGRFDVVPGFADDQRLVERLRGFSFDTVTCVNVLEHVPDDARALANFHAILAPSRGMAVLFVPAHRALYGAPDRAAGHLRRYERSDLLQLLGSSGFLPERVEFVNRFGAAGWFLNARVFAQGDLNASAVSRQIRLFDRLVPALRAVERVVRPSFGQSLFAVARAGPN